MCAGWMSNWWPLEECPLLLIHCPCVCVGIISAHALRCKEDWVGSCQWQVLPFKHAYKIHLTCLLCALHVSHLLQCALHVSHLLQCVLYYSDHITVLVVRGFVVRVVMERDKVLWCDTCVCGDEVEQFGRLMTRHEKQWLSCLPLPLPPSLEV